MRASTSSRCDSTSRATRASGLRLTAPDLAERAETSTLSRIAGWAGTCQSFAAQIFVGRLNDPRKHSELTRRTTLIAYATTQWFRICSEPIRAPDSTFLQ